MKISSHVQKLVLADRRDTEPSSLSPNSASILLWRLRPSLEGEVKIPSPVIN